MITGEAYFMGDHDILRRKRTVIGEGGKIETVDNLPNNRLIDNQYGKMVDQKNNYLLSKQITFSGKNEKYIDELMNIFGGKFQRTLKGIGEDCLNGGIAWLYVYCNDDGELTFKRFKPYEIMPFWKDSEHTELDFVVRVYDINEYEGEKEVVITKVEVYTPIGIKRYVLDGLRLIEDIEKPTETYLTDSEGENFNWERLPVIPFKQNSKEIPLIKRVKSLQDALNTVRSDFMNNTQEDARNTILVLKNYDGTKLDEFRRNLAVYGAIKVRYDGDVKGGVESLKIDVDSNKYVVICDMLKKAIIENARGYDARDERMSSNPNQMNIMSMYNDIDLDADGMEREFKASFEELIWFVNTYLSNMGKGDFKDEKVEIIFNRDRLINETDVINNCKSSLDIISDETVVSMHPWVTDVKGELEKLKKQREEQIPINEVKDYGEDFKHNHIGDMGAGGESAEK
ncbi:MAG: phage portal protein [Clostridiales bacterium]|nr:phage portal protein [Clostridiales bacterium]